MKPPKKIKLT